jgi:hypothetical protein
MHLARNPFQTASSKIYPYDPRIQRVSFEFRRWHNLILVHNKPGRKSCIGPGEKIEDSRRGRSGAKIMRVAAEAGTRQHACFIELRKSAGLVLPFPIMVTLPQLRKEVLNHNDLLFPDKFAELDIDFLNVPDQPMSEESVYRFGQLSGGTLLFKFFDQVGKGIP